MSARLPLKDYAFIAEFAAFCRTKGDEIYPACEADRCALAQFGYPGAQCAGDTNNLAELGVPRNAFEAALAGRYPYRFSALADRLEALLVDLPRVVM